MAVPDLPASLTPLQRRAVSLVYFDRRSTTEAASILQVEKAAVAAALAGAFRRIAHQVLDGHEGGGSGTATSGRGGSRCP